MVEIKVVNPVVQGVLGDDILPPVPDFVRLQPVWLPEGPSSVESRYDSVMTVPRLLEAVRAAAEEADGIVINCFMDPGLKAAREIVTVPVAGPAEAAMLLASTLGQSFSVILPAASGAPITREEAIAYGVADRLASVRSVEMPVAALADRERLTGALTEQAELALEKDGAHVVILGCTGMCAVTSAVRKEMRNRGHEVPVIDPTLAAVGWVVSAYINGVRQSPLCYSLPSWKSETE